MKFRVQNSNYLLKEVQKVDQADNKGECNIETKIIKVKSSLSKEEKIRTIFHEVIHGYIEEMGFNLSETFEEVICVTLENTIFDNFKVTLK